MVSPWMNEMMDAYVGAYGSAKSKNAEEFVRHVSAFYSLVSSHRSDIERNASQKRVVARLERVLWKKAKENFSKEDLYNIGLLLYQKGSLRAAEMAFRLSGTQKALGYAERLRRQRKGPGSSLQELIRKKLGPEAEQRFLKAMEKYQEGNPSDALRDLGEVYREAVRISPDLAKRVDTTAQRISKTSPEAREVYAQVFGREGERAVSSQKGSRARTGVLARRSPQRRQAIKPRPKEVVAKAPEEEPKVMHGFKVAPGFSKESKRALAELAGYLNAPSPVPGGKSPRASPFLQKLMKEATLLRVDKKGSPLLPFPKTFYLYFEMDGKYYVAKVEVDKNIEEAPNKDVYAVMGSSGVFNVAVLQSRELTKEEVLALGLKKEEKAEAPGGREVAYVGP